MSLKTKAMDIAKIEVQATFRTPAIEDYSGQMKEATERRSRSSPHHVIIES